MSNAVVCRRCCCMCPVSSPQPSITAEELTALQASNVDTEKAKKLLQCLKTWPEQYRVEDLSSNIQIVATLVKQKVNPVNLSDGAGADLILKLDGGVEGLLGKDSFAAMDVARFKGGLLWLLDRDDQNKEASHAKKARKSSGALLARLHGFLLQPAAVGAPLGLGPRRPIQVAIRS